MTAREKREGLADEPDPVAMRIAEEERRRTGAFLRDYLARHRIENLPGESESDETESDSGR
jgi:hypothetical protein